MDAADADVGFIVHAGVGCSKSFGHLKSDDDAKN